MKIVAFGTAGAQVLSAAFLDDCGFGIALKEALEGVILRLGILVYCMCRFAPAFSK